MHFTSGSSSWIVTRPETASLVDDHSTSGAPGRLAFARYGLNAVTPSTIMPDRRAPPGGVMLASELFIELAQSQSVLPQLCVSRSNNSMSSRPQSPQE